MSNLINLMENIPDSWVGEQKKDETRTNKCANAKHVERSKTIKHSFHTALSCVAMCFNFFSKW